MPNLNNDSPILLFADNQTELTILRLAFEREGFRLFIKPAANCTPSLEDQPLSILSCSSKTRTDPWLEYIRKGGVLIICNPNNNFANQFGLEDYEGTSDRGGLLSLRLFDNEDPVHIQIFGTVTKYHKTLGSVKGILREAESNSKQFPGIVERSVGHGKVLILLFSLAHLISYFHQRTNALARETGGGSAEKIALSGVNKQFLALPQLDVLLGFLTRFVIAELSRLDKPIPRFGYLPSGYLSLVIFSFDDFCPSGSPIRKAASSLVASLKATEGVSKCWQGIYHSVVKLSLEIISYPQNYKTHVCRLITLFRKYAASGSAFILPFFGPVKNKVALTGYKGFSKRSYFALKEAGWDVGTHIKPMALSDYDHSQRKFQSHFGSPPLGHRGHRLGWVEWEKDWQKLESLDYVYDSTWNWGGPNSLTWILGTAFPFRPVDRNGKPFAILEIPVVAWIKDLYKTPEKSLREIETMLNKYPGVFNFAGHSWKITEQKYLDFIEKTLEIAQRKENVGLELNLAQLSEFWNCRELSSFEKLSWDKEKGIVSFNTISRCQDISLTTYIPYYWKKRKIESISIRKEAVDYDVKEVCGVHYAVIINHQASNYVTVSYR